MFDHWWIIILNIWNNVIIIHNYLVLFITWMEGYDDMGYFQPLFYTMLVPVCLHSIDSVDPFYSAASLEKHAPQSCMDMDPTLSHT